MATFDYHIVDFRLLGLKNDESVYRLKASLVPVVKVGMPEEKFETTQVTAEIHCSFELITNWQSDDPTLKDAENLHKVLCEHSRRQLDKNWQEGTIEQSIILTFTSGNTPDHCPYDPETIQIDPNKRYTVQLTRPIGFRP